MDVRTYFSFCYWIAFNHWIFTITLAQSFFIKLLRSWRCVCFFSVVLLYQLSAFFSFLVNVYILSFTRMIALIWRGKFLWMKRGYIARLPLWPVHIMPMPKTYSLVMPMLDVVAYFGSCICQQSPPHIIIVIILIDILLKVGWQL